MAILVNILDFVIFFFRLLATASLCVSPGRCPLPAFTTTKNEHDAELPETSVKVYVTLVIPTGKLLPGKKLLVRAGSKPESSVAVGTIHEATAPVSPGATETTTLFIGQPVISGGVTSLLEAVKETTISLNIDLILN